MGQAVSPPKRQRDMLTSQTYTAVAADENGKLLAFYILHPNNIGRCGHIANASYGVDAAYRGMGIGRLLVTDSLKMTKECGFTALQFNAVVASNRAALALYPKLGFERLCEIKNGFRSKDGRFIDTVMFYHAV